MDERQKGRSEGRKLKIFKNFKMAIENLTYFNYLTINELHSPIKRLN